MGIDYCACDRCGETFPDVVDYGWCDACGSTFCSSCKEELLEDEWKYDDEDGEFLECPECNKPTLDKNKFNKLMYGLLKEASRVSFVEFLENWNLTEEDYEQIKKYLECTYGIKMYL